MQLRNFLVLTLLAFQAGAYPSSLEDWYEQFQDEIDFQDDISPVNGTNGTVSLEELGLTEALLEELKINLQKAIEKETEDSRYRQNVGDFFGIGGGAGTGTGLAGQDEEDDDEDVSLPPGPGPFGVLSGIFGIFAGLGSLNPRRVLQSTVNFFPPDQRTQAQMALDQIFGPQPNVTTLAPLTDAPLLKTTEKPGSLLNASATTLSPESSTVKKAFNSSGTLQEDEVEPQDFIKANSLENEFSKTANMLGTDQSQNKNQTLNLNATAIKTAAPSMFKEDIERTLITIEATAASMSVNESLPSDAKNATASHTVKVFLADSFKEANVTRLKTDLNETTSL